MRLCRCPFILLANFSFSNIHLLIHIIWCLQVLFGLSSPICCLRRRIYYRRLAQVWSRRTEGPTGDDHLGCKEGHLCLFETSPWHSSEPFWAIIWGVFKIFHQNVRRSRTWPKRCAKETWRPKSCHWLWWNLSPTTTPCTSAGRCGSWCWSKLDAVSNVGRAQNGFQKVPISSYINQPWFP